MAGGAVASDEQLASVGRPNPLVRVEIMDDAGRILPRGETGEICVRGAAVFAGYHANPEATAKALRRVPSRARLALTGTPVENRLTELWALLDWTTPGLLGSVETFRRRISIPIERELMSSSPRHQLRPACQARLSSATRAKTRPSSSTTSTKRSARLTSRVRSG